MKNNGRANKFTYIKRPQIDEVVLKMTTHNYHEAKNDLALSLV
jgi:hypothetical protein